MNKRYFQMAVILGALALCYFAVAVTLANAAATRGPGLALKIWPSHAVAHASLAGRIMEQGPSTGNIERAGGEAIAALRRDPSLADAARNLGLRASLRRDEPTALRMLNYSAQMSRRDVPTQMWLLERQVQRNNVEGALDHYAIILQISPPMRETLYGVLTGALRDPQLVRPIATMTKNGTSWNSGFLTYAIGNATDLRSMGRFLFTLRELGVPPPKWIIQELIRKMLVQNDVTGASRVYALADRRWRAGDPNSQLDGGFDQVEDVPPFGWTLDSPTAWRDARPGGGRNSALYFNLPTSGTAPVARRLILVPAGAYALSGMIGSDGPTAGGTLHVTLSCRDNRQSGFITVPLAVRGRFTRPLRAAGCGLQQLSISVEHQGAGETGSIWIDDLRLMPQAGGL